MLPDLVRAGRVLPAEPRSMACRALRDAWVAARVARVASVVRLPVSRLAPEEAEQA